MPGNKKISIDKTKKYGNDTHKKAAPPDEGKQADHFSRSGATLQKCVRRFALAKVSTDRLTEGASVRRKIKEFLTKRY